MLNTAAGFRRVHLHRNLNQKQHIFAFQIAPVTAVKLLDSITSSRIRVGQFWHAKTGSNLDANQQALGKNPFAVHKLPPILVFKSTVDSTVTTDAVVDNLLKRLPDGRNELVLFDINRNAAIKSALLVSDPVPLTQRLMADPDLPFAVTFVTNENPNSANVVAQHKAPLSLQASATEDLELAWPRDVVSLSHVALPIPPDDPLYGQHLPQNNGLIFLGDLAIKGEQGLLKISAEWLLRMRYNPFYTYLQKRVLQWLDNDEVPHL
jgi:hypothetical protein